MTGRREELIARSLREFSHHPRPGRLTVSDPCCPEGPDHESALTGVVRETFSVENLGPLSWSPIPYLNPAALAYFFPCLVELAVSAALDLDGSPYLTRFIALVSVGPDNARFRDFTPGQRQVVSDTLLFLRDRFFPLVVQEGWEPELVRAVESWSPV